MAEAALENGKGRKSARSSEVLLLLSERFHKSVDWDIAWRWELADFQKFS